VIRALIASVVVTLAATGVFSWATDGFSAFTAETARRVEVLRHPRPIPPVVLEDQNGRAFTLADYRGRQLALEFIYVRCDSVCRSLGAAFRQLSEALPAGVLGRDIALLSISFDPRNDDLAALREWAGKQGADGEHWRVARPRDAGQTAALLQAFGVVVVPDGLGGYEHNAAIHLLGRDGRLVRISDIEAPRDFIAALAPQP